MKIVVSFFLLLFVSTSYSQDYSFEQLYKGINEDNAIAARSKIKTEIVYGHKSETSTKGEFLYKKNFSKEGRLINSRWLDKSINKFVDSEFSYDTQGRLVKMTNNVNSLVYNLDLTIINYSNDKIASMFHFYGPKESVKMDTLRFYYNPEGQLVQKILKHRVEGNWKIDTVDYVYKNNALWYAQKKVMKSNNAVYVGIGVGLGGAVGGLMLWIALDNIVGQSVEKTLTLNMEGCETKIRHPFKEDFIEVKRDSLCNMLYWEYSTEADGEWFVTQEGNRTYNGNLKTEEKVYSGKVGFDKSRAGMLSFDEHQKYNYSPDGLLHQKCWYKENGKLKRVQKHTYEFY